MHPALAGGACIGIWYGIWLAALGIGGAGVAGAGGAGVWEFSMPPSLLAAAGLRNEVPCPATQRQWCRKKCKKKT